MKNRLAIHSEVKEQRNIQLYGLINGNTVSKESGAHKEGDRHSVFLVLAKKVAKTVAGWLF